MGRGSYLGGSTILRGARGALGLLPSQRRPGKKKTPMATDSWASATHGGGSHGAGWKTSSKPKKAKKPKAGGTDVVAENVEERVARRQAAMERRRAAEMKRLAGIQVVTKRGNRTLSECSLADRVTDADPSP